MQRDYPPEWSGAEVSIDPAQLEQMSVEEENSTTDAMTGTHVVASPPKTTKSDETSKGKGIRFPTPFSQRLRKQKHECWFKKFLDILKQVHINLPLEIFYEQTRLSEFETIVLNKGCMKILHN
ncbi:hypothetical protein GQ457_14G026700 [Hibiscus cannabinus]